MLPGLCFGGIQEERVRRGDGLASVSCDGNGHDAILDRKAWHGSRALLEALYSYTA